MEDTEFRIISMSLKMMLIFLRQEATSVFSSAHFTPNYPQKQIHEIERPVDFKCPYTFRVRPLNPVVKCSATTVYCF